MTDTKAIAAKLSEQIMAAPRKGRRRLVALAGPPASGKSTFAEQLAEALIGAGSQTQVVPMDGFHLHNPILIERDLLSRKGAPETFDAAGFYELIRRLGIEDAVFFPTFDRARDIAIAGAGQVDANVDTIIVEGNYLLFDEPVWRDLHPLWDFAIRLDVPMDVLRARLVARWLEHGLSTKQAEARASENDLPNAERVIKAALSADATLTV